MGVSARVSRLALAATGLAGMALALAAGCGGSAEQSAASKPVRFAQVQAVLARYACAACHPLVNPSLDLRRGHEYASLVGVRALEDPRLVRVIAGDPERSFLYQKIAGDPKLGDIPAIGARMPQGAPRMAQADIDLVAAWIRQGAKNAQGRTAGPTVPTPGPAAASPVASEPSVPTGDATIQGVVEDQRHRPLASAIVTLLLRGQDQPGGEEHYRVAATDASGRYRLAHAPVGQYLLKAYAPQRIYVSRIVALADRQTATIDFGLADRVIRNPVVARPRAARAPPGMSLAMTVTGSSLDPNYTLAVNPDAGLVFELHRPDGGPGRWTRRISRWLSGRWIFLAVDHQCNISNFVTVSG
jgi:mono/diheme cytochrome c family protein